MNVLLWICVLIVGANASMAVVNIMGGHTIGWLYALATLVWIGLAYLQYRRASSTK